VFTRIFGHISATSGVSRRCLFVVLALAFMGMALKPLNPRSAPQASVQEDKTLSPFFVVLSDDPEKDALPLKSTKAEVKIAGKVAEVKVTQIYKNEGKKTLEAIYVFPASTRAAVHAMRMMVGNRVVEAEIMERQKARQTYEDAKKEGKTTSLLEQQRPNVFQMNVANILPGDEVKVELNYLELLKAEDNVYEFVYPTVVGPRYSNMPAAGAPDSEKWVQNPYLHEGQGPTYTFGLNLEVRGGLPISRLTSPSHEVEVKYPNPTQALVTLKDEKTGGNRDFVLRYALAGNKIDAGLLLYPGQDENFFLLVMEPPARTSKEAAVPREYLFIVDVSGSMHGFPLDISKALMADIFKKLRPQDYMNVLLFESGSAVLSETGSLPATEENKKKALAFIQSQPGGGGTEILPAFRRALALPRTPGTSRIVVVATDGYVNVEPELFELVRQNLGEANLFPFGIGTAVNRYLIEGLARAGRGEPFIVLNPGEAPRQAERFQQYIATPVLTGIRVEFKGFQAYDLEPQSLPDLFALRPLALLGKYRGKPEGTIVISGKTAAGDFRREIKVDSGQASSDNSALKYLWARERIQRLSDYQRLTREKDPAKVKEITDLGLKYSLMTAFTSFVAVDKVKRADGTLETVKQPVPLPEGVSELAVGDAGAYKLSGRSLMTQAFPGPKGELAESRKPWSLPVPGAASPPLGAGEGKPATPASKLKLVATLVTGEVDLNAVKQALEAETARLEKCCREVLAQGGRLSREIPFLLTIGPDGRVTRVDRVIKSGISVKLDRCLREILKQVIYPKPAKGPATVKIVLGLANQAP